MIARVLLAGLLLALAPSARAQDADPAPSGAEALWGPWDFGLDFGIAIPTGRNNFSHGIDNARAYDLIAAEGVGDESAEGWKPPPLPGGSTVAGSLRNVGQLGMHVYRTFNPWLAWGLEGAYGLKSQVRVDSPGIYVPGNFLILHYSANVSHVALPVKLGRAYGPFRPYVIAGPGAYMVSERATISFSDSDDPQLKPIEIVHKDACYAGLAGGAGVEVHVDHGLLAVELQYHKVFSPGGHNDFLLPKLRFSVLF